MTGSPDHPIRMPRIAIPMPHSGDRDYAERSVTQYENAVRLAGGEPVRIELDQSSTEVRKQIEHGDAVLLRGSRADVDPNKYNAPRHEKTAETDARRDAVDPLLLEGAYHTRKPGIGTCCGPQSAQVDCSGSLVQHIESAINHSAGGAVANAHMVQVDPRSRLADIIGGEEKAIAVNS